MGMLLEASRLAYNVLRVVGAGYLIFLGCKIFLQSGSSSAHNGSLDFAVNRKYVGRGNLRDWFVRGALTNLLNPKVGIFYVTFLPQFIPMGVKVVRFSMLLASIHAIEGVLWFGILIAVVGHVSVWLQQAQVAKMFDRITGTVFVGFGRGLLFEHRR